MTLAENIRKIRESKGKTQKEVASLMGISQQAYSQYESGAREPKPETLGRIAAALEIEFKELYPAIMSSEKKWSHDHLHDFLYGVQSQWEVERNNSPKSEILQLFQRLNDNGQARAAEYIEELAQIPKYQRQPAGENAQTAPAAPDDKDPTRK